MWTPVVLYVNVVVRVQHTLVNTLTSGSTAYRLHCQWLSNRWCSTSGGPQSDAHTPSNDRILDMLQQFQSSQNCSMTK